MTVSPDSEIVQKMPPAPQKKRGALDGIMHKMFANAGLLGAVESMHAGFPIPGKDVVVSDPVVAAPIISDVVIDDVLVSTPPSLPKPKPIAKKSAITSTATPDTLIAKTGNGTYNGTGTGTLNGIDSGILNGTPSGTDADLHNGLLNGIDANIHANIQADMDADTSAYMPISVDTDANIHANSDADTVNGRLSGRTSGTDTRTDNGIHSGTPSGTQDGTYLYSHIDPQAFFPFTPGQGRVLLYLIDAGGKANRNTMASQLGVPLDTLAKTLKMLEKKGYIKRGDQRIYEHRERGFYYAIDRQLCSEFKSRVFGIYSDTQDGIYSGIHASMSTGIHANTQRGTSNGIHAGIIVGTQPSFSSSKFLEKEKNLTTTEPGLLDDPELRFWKTEGITAGSVRGWLKEPWAIENGVSVEMLLKSLRHLRYEIVENGQTPDKPDNWAYKIIIKNFGEYEAKNYRSYESIKLEKIEKERAELAEVRKRLAIAERELAFEKILANPDGSEYQDLLSRVDNSFAIELGGQELEHALRDVFFGVKS